jgi:hypothetical protein
MIPSRKLYTAVSHPMALSRADWFSIPQAPRASEPSHRILALRHTITASRIWIATQEAYYSNAKEDNTISGSIADGR